MLSISRDRAWRAAPGRGSIRQYQLALDLSLENRVRHTSQLETRGEQFVQSIAVLDHRVAVMQELVVGTIPDISHP